MRSLKIMLMGMATAVFLIAMPLTSFAAYEGQSGSIVWLQPSESQQIEAGGGTMPHMTVEPSIFTHNTGRIELLLPSESQEVETGGGVTSHTLIAPSVFTHNTSHIEWLLPAEE